MNKEKFSRGNKMRKTLFFFCLSFFCLLVSCEDPIYFEEETDGDLFLHVLPASYSNYTNAHFALHVPEFEGNLRGILVIVPGFNSDGRYFKDEPVFRNFAREERLAIISCYFAGDINYYNYYYNPEFGSGIALLRVIEEFAVRKEMPELTSAPLLFWGHSAGGIYSYSFANWKPEMVVACTPVRSAEFSPEPSDSVKNIPMMFLGGELDSEWWLEDCVNFCIQNRSSGALWGYAIEPEAGHGIAYSTDLSLSFLSSSLRQRVGEGVSHYSEMLPVSEESGWLGNYFSKMVYPFSQYPNNKSEAAWFPDDVSANAWVNYTKGIFSAGQLLPVFQN